MKYFLYLAAAAGFLPILIIRVCEDCMFQNYFLEKDKSYPCRTHFVTDTVVRTLGPLFTSVSP